MTVTDEDRKAAASGYFAWCSGNETIPNKMLAGHADDHSMVQAFARHRQAAYAAGLERAAVIAEEWRDENKESAAEAQQQGNNGFAAELRTAAVECNALATAIRAEKDKT